MKSRKSLWQAVKGSVTKWVDDDAFEMAAALSYYTLFSLAPLIIIAVGVAGIAFGREAAQNQILGTFQGMIGQDSARAVQGIVENASKRPDTGILSTIVGIVVLIFGAAGVVGQLQTSLNRIWSVAPKPGRGMGVFVRQRFISLAMILGIGFLLMVSLLVSAVVTAFAQWMGGVFGGIQLAIHALDLIISSVFTTTLFAMIYKFLPDIHIIWRDVFIGAVMTAFLFTVGKFLIGLYLGTSAVTSTYGAAGSLITVLLWVYYSALIFFLGAEFTQVYATQFGAGVAPAEYAQLTAATAGTQQEPRPPGQGLQRPGTRSAENRH